ncbi:autoinducer 2 ABC transporter substrate-binding protein [Paenibacillus sediminis]|uniref:Simple sugar transport system substrate-binding protein/rhamnose transport system substrate-binding protein n=1 Tax=Paenibacillus sediminis TaxID=664909 RepID=A0ABS4GYK6_9BACL|nr:autoinducer 2 ABC transporter substrate-binding protein [Paenibacillus sediminis]MBP1935339.1 simple sugar transport system substrate-binding protein/rhamnose transport system substrate-binding protein [Paenibacillus sediminis]
MRKKAVSLLLSSVLMVGMLAGCGTAKSTSDAAGQGSKNGKITVAIVPKLVGIPYFNASEKGAKQAGEDLGVNVIYTGPTQADAAQQVKVIEDLIAKKVDVIAVAPNDADALTPVLRKAKAQGIKVMDWDTKADQSVVDLSVQQVDDEVYGRHMADLLVKATYQKTLDLLKANPDLDGILAYSTVAPLGAAQAIQEKGLQNKVSLVGVALPTDSKPFLEDGSLDTATLWNPINLGYLTVAAAKDLAEGKKIENGQEIKNIGKVEVKDDGKTIILGPPTDFTKENASNFDF